MALVVSVICLLWLSKSNLTLFNSVFLATIKLLLVFILLLILLSSELNVSILEFKVSSSSLNLLFISVNAAEFLLDSTEYSLSIWAKYSLYLLVISVNFKS